MPVVTVRNTRSGPATFRDEETKAEYKWEGAGDASGRDVLEVPDKIAENIFFRRALNLGVFSILGDDEIAAALSRQAASWGSEQDALLKQAQDALEDGSEVALVTLTIDETEDPETGIVRETTTLPSQAEIDRQVATARQGGSQ